MAVVTRDTKYQKAKVVARVYFYNEISVFERLKLILLTLEKRADPGWQVKMQGEK